MKNRFKTFKVFYPYYLSQHSNLTCRALHFIGTSIVIVLVLIAIWTSNLKLLIYVPLAGYGFAWIGHFVFEKNKPATFVYPLYSLASDFKMFFELLTLKLSFKS